MPTATYSCSIHLSIYLSIYVSVCLSIYLSISTVSAFYINVIYILINQGDIFFKSVIFRFLRIFNKIFIYTYIWKATIGQPVDHVLQSFQNDYFMLGIFVHLSKAFDKVNHWILLKNLKCIVYREKNVTLFKNCLSNRKQFVKRLKEISTDMQLITCVPQGPILGLLCFMLVTHQNHLRFLI